MQEQYRDQIVAISWNLDHDADDGQPSESLQEQVLAKLVALKLSCLNVVSSDPIYEVQSHFDVLALPAVLIYDSEGKLAQKFEGEISYDADVAPFVATLLKRAEGS